MESREHDNPVPVESLAAFLSYSTSSSKRDERSVSQCKNELGLDDGNFVEEILVASFDFGLGRSPVIGWSAMYCVRDEHIASSKANRFKVSLQKLS
jgi:hypothetical protein